MQLVDLIPEQPDADELLLAFSEWAESEGRPLYPHQEEAAIELFSGNHLILATPTGSGKSMVAIAAHFAALATGRRTFYTAPIKALVSEKFFDLCRVFGADNVGMQTGDASVNADAPIICCTAEVLANLALREGAHAEVGQVVMDEFHYYAEPQRGWAWQVPLLLLPQAQFVLMSATLGDTRRIREDLERRTGVEVSVVDGAERPVPLSFEWSTDPLHERLERLVADDRAPVYVVHFTQASALERAQSLLSAKLCSRQERDAIADEIGAFKFTSGFGRTLSKLVRAGIGVHHAGMLPRYRRLVEQLAQRGLLKVICGTDTLGVGINVPIRTVVFTALTKYDGTNHRLLKAREFHQIAGRAGRAGFDTAGYVVVQAPEHVIENARRIAKAGDDPKKQKRVQKVKAPEGQVSWTEDTYHRIRNAEPESLVSRMKVDHSTILNVVQQPGDAVETMQRLLEESHEDERGRTKLIEQAMALGDELLAAGVLEWLGEPDAHGRRLALAEELQEDFALNQPLASFALAAMERVIEESEDPTLDLVSVVEAILDDPWPVLADQTGKARAEAVAAMKEEGIEYEERMALLEEVTYPKPLGEPLMELFDEYRSTHPWVRRSDLSPKSVVREMFELGMGFSEYVGFHGIARAEGLLLRYLSDAYRALRRTIPESLRTEELDELVDWLGEVVRQTDSSLLDEWEALTDPEQVAEAAERAAASEPAPPARPVTANTRAFRVMLRGAMFMRVQLAARDRFDELGRLEQEAAALVQEAHGGSGPVSPAMDTVAWEDGLGAYWEAHEAIGTGPDARGPELFLVDTANPRLWTVRQVIDDPAGDRDWSIVAIVDLDASDHAGEPVILGESFGRSGY
jgi:superfamily II RNA helicase